MEIQLTRSQWTKLKALINAAKRAESKLGLPIGIDNGDQKIELAADEVKITLAD